MNSSDQHPSGDGRNVERDAERLRRLMRAEIAQGRPGSQPRAESASSPASPAAPVVAIPPTNPSASVGGGGPDEPDRPRWRRRLGPIAAIAAGCAIAMLAYAGGGDLLTQWFGGGRSAPIADTYDALAAPVLLDSVRTDSAAAAKPAVAAARDTSKTSVAADSAAAAGDSSGASNDTAVAADRRTPIEAATRRDQPEVRDTVARRDTVVSAPRRPLSGRYIVQVRATADIQQAETLARRLRRAGLANVSITESSREGETTYRVRYGAFASESEARASAAAHGLSDVWIVRR